MIILFLSLCSTNKATLLFTAFLPQLHLNKQMHTKHKKNEMAKHMDYFFFSSSFHLQVTRNKNNHKSLYIACSTLAQHNYQTSCLLKSIISTIHPDKNKTILTASCLHDIFDKFSPQHLGTTLTYFSYLSLVAEP